MVYCTCVFILFKCKTILNHTHQLSPSHSDKWIDTREKTHRRSLCFKGFALWRDKSQHPFTSDVNLIRLRPFLKWAIWEEQGSQVASVKSWEEHSVSVDTQGNQEETKGRGLRTRLRRREQGASKTKRQQSNFISFATWSKISLALGSHRALETEDTCPSWPSLT